MARAVSGAKVKGPFTTVQKSPGVVQLLAARQAVSKAAIVNAFDIFPYVLNVFCGLRVPRGGRGSFVRAARVPAGPIGPAKGRGEQCESERP